MLIHYAGITCPKMGSTQNEDCLLMLDLLQQSSREVACGQVEVVSDNSVRFAIADGLGGMPSADRASYQLLAELSGLDGQGFALSPSQMAEKLRDRTVQLSLADPSLENAATTLITAEIYPDHIRLWHAGDSRAYLRTETELTQLTRDQTMLRTMRDRGELTEEEAETVRGTALFDSVDECFVFAALSDIPAIQTKKLECPPEGVLLLASDGLHRHLSHEEIHAWIDPAELG